MNKLLFFASLLAFACACTAPQRPCGSLCYNPATGSCPTDKVTGRPVACSAPGEEACLGTCFNPATQYCADDYVHNYPGNPAPPPPPQPTPKTSSTTSSTSSTTSSTSSTTSSTSSTTSSTTKSTTSSTVAPPTTSSTVTPPNTGAASSCNCGSGQSCCNGGCFTPGQYNCAQDPVTGQDQLCPGSEQACNHQCYSTSSYSCVNGALVQGAGQTPAQPTPVATSTTQAAAQPTTSAASVGSSLPNAVVNPEPAPNSGNYPTQTADLRIINSCKNVLWFEARYGGAGAALPGQTTTATIALPGGYVDYTIPATGLSGSRFWAKYGCNSVGQNCLIGDQMQYWPNPPGGCPPDGCTPPVDSLFEATWGCKPGTSCNAGNPTTWFDTSQVDGWTIPYKLTANGDTNTCDCNGDVCGFSGVDASTLDLSKCPTTEDLTGGGIQPTATVGSQTVSLSSVDLRIINNGSVLGCLSPCKRLNWSPPYGLSQPEGSGSTLWMCCPTPTPNDCTTADGCVTSTQCRDGPVVSTQYVNAVHTMAPGVYSYAYDDGVGLHACAAGVVTYTMEFCPAGSSPYPAPVS